MLFFFQIHWTETVGQSNERKTSDNIHKLVYLHLPDEDEDFVKYVKDQIVSHGGTIADKLEGNVNYFIAREKLLKKASSTHLKVGNSYANSRSLALIKKSMQQSAGSTPVSIVEKAKRLSIKLKSLEKLISCFQSEKSEDSKSIPQKALKEPFLKLEDNNRAFRPVYFEFSSKDFPRLYFITNFWKSPFRLSQHSLKEITHIPSKISSAGLHKPRKQRLSKYCELCKELFTSLRSHLQTAKHKTFSNDNHNFVEVDAMIALIQSVNIFEPRPTSIQHSDIVMNSDDVHIEPSETTVKVNPYLSLRCNDLDNKPNNCDDYPVFSSFDSTSSILKVTVFQALALIESDSPGMELHHNSNLTAENESHHKVGLSYDTLELSQAAPTPKSNNCKSNLDSDETAIPRSSSAPFGYDIPRLSSTATMGQRHQTLTNILSHSSSVKENDYDESGVGSPKYCERMSSGSFPDCSSFTKNNLIVETDNLVEHVESDTEFDECLSSVSSMAYTSDIYNCTKIDEDGLKFHFKRIR